MFSPIHAYCILKFYPHHFILGMYLLARFLLRDNEKENKNLISTIIALMFSLIPFWPTGELTVAGQPLLLFSFLNLINKRNRILSWSVIFFFPFFSSLHLGNIFL